MPKLELFYWDFDGGRGEAARLAFAIGGVDFQDHRIKFPDWPKHRPNMPFPAVPVLLVDGVAVAQSNAINRYVGKLTGLYPEHPLQAAFCDEAMDAIEDIAVRVVRTFQMEEEEKKREREILADGFLKDYLRCLNQRLEARGSEYFADHRLTVADLKVFVHLRHLVSGNVDYLPTDLPERVAPLLVEHLERIKSHPKIAAYYADR